MVIIILQFTFVIIVLVVFGSVRTKNTIQWLPFISALLPHSFVVIPVGLHVSPPEMLELLRHFGRGDLLESEDEDPGEDDAEDVDEGEGETDQTQQEGLQRKVL